MEFYRDVTGPLGFEIIKETLNTINFACLVCIILYFFIIIYSIVVIFAWFLGFI